MLSLRRAVAHSPVAGDHHGATPSTPEPGEIRDDSIHPGVSVGWLKVML
jgi:hypothetical protein